MAQTKISNQKFKYKTEYLTLFVLSVLYSLYGIVHISHGGGPCNAGIDVLFLGSAILFCVIPLAIAFLTNLSRYQSVSEKKKAILMCFIAFIIWAFCILKVSDATSLEKVLFLGPFECFIILSLIINLRAKSN